MSAPSGAWPVVLTPYAEDGAIDHPALARYADWLVDSGAAGLFAVALSGEMYELTLAERLAAVRTIVDAVDRRVPIAAAALGDEGSLADEVGDLISAGAGIAVLIVSTVLSPDDDEERLHEVVAELVAAHPDAVLGLYECPLPHHRLLSLDAVERLAATGRFAFLKETSHDVDVMAERVRVAAPHGLGVFNAGIENYAESLQVGVSGLSGWVVTVAPDAVAALTGSALADGLSPAVLALQAELAAAEQAMGPTYPASAKAIFAARTGIPWRPVSRWRPSEVDEALVADLAARLDARED